MSLHPQVKAVLEAMEARGLPPLEQQSVAEARAAFEMSAKAMSKPLKTVETENLKIEGFKKPISLRVYTPQAEGELPALIYYHGGGWVIGNIETHDALCHSLAAESGCKVISVDYSLAPDEKFPAAVEDAYLAVKWAADHAGELGIDKGKLAVGGDSAGGNLAAAVCWLATRRSGPEISWQMLIYPSTGYHPTESYEKYGDGYYLTKATMAWFREHYLHSPEDTQNPLAAPLLIPGEETAALPPAYILTAEYDPLCDGGEQFARKLEDAGVEVNYVCYPGMIHGFIGMTEYLDDGKRAVKELAAALKSRYTAETAGNL